MIQKNVFQTWKTQNFPQKIEKILNKNRKLNPDFKFHIYTDDQLLDFVKSNYDSEIFNAFEKIKHKSLLKNVEINTISYVWFPKIVADHMAQNKTKGSIIQISSIYGLVAQNNQIYKNTNL